MSQDTDLPVVEVGDAFTTHRKPGQKFVAYRITKMDEDEGVLYYSIDVEGRSSSWGNKQEITTIRRCIQNGSWKRIELRTDQLGPFHSGSMIDYSALARLVGLYEADLTDWFRKHLEVVKDTGGDAFAEAERLLTVDPWQAVIWFAEEMRAERQRAAAVASRKRTPF